MGIQFDEIDLDKNEAVDRVMNDFDTSNDQHIDEQEFIKGVSKWLIEAKHYGTSGPDAGSNSLRFLDAAHNVSFLMTTFFSCSFLRTRLSVNSLKCECRKQREITIFWGYKVMSWLRLLRTRSGLPLRQ